MKIAVFLSALVCSTLAAPNLLEGVAHSEPAAYSYPAPAPVPEVKSESEGYSYTAPAVGLVEGTAPVAAETLSAGGAAAGGAPVVGITRDDRVVEETGAYSFDVAGEDGTARQESGAPLAEGGISQTGSYTYTQDDGTVFELKYVADAGGFQPESAALPPVPQFVLDQIAFAKANPEAEGAEGAPAAPNTSYLAPAPAPAPTAPETSYLAPAPAPAPAPDTSYLAPAPAPAPPGSSYLPPGRR